MSSLLQRCRDAGAPIEAHIDSRGGHGFKMAGGAKLTSIKNWPARLQEWMDDGGFLSAAK